MNNFINNNNKNNNKKLNNVFTLRSNYVTEIDNKIENVHIFQISEKYLQSKTSEVGKIINNKNRYSVQNANLNIESTIKNNITLPKFLLPYNKGDVQSNVSSNIKDSVKYFSLGNKAMNLNVFKTLLKNFNTDVKKIENSNKNYHTNILRYYLNLITKFEFDMPNNNYNLYKFNKTNKYIFAMKKAAKFLNRAFNSKGCFISKPSFNIIKTNDKIENEIIKNSNLNLNATKVIINLFYFIKINEISSNKNLIGDNNATLLSDLFGQKLSYLIDYLTYLFNAEIELNLVRLYKPYQDSNILVQYLNSESYSNKFIRLVSRLFKNINLSNSTKSEIFSDLDLSAIGQNNYNSYPSKISGINVKLAGRPLNERIIPRLTVKRAQRGSFNRLNAKMIEKSMYTDKTRKGAYSFTVTLSQNFN